MREERAAPLKKDIAAIQKRITDLEAKLPDEQKQKTEFDSAQVEAQVGKNAEYIERVRSRIEEMRRDMSLMPPDLPKLSQDGFRAGRFGQLPQWPPGGKGS